MQFLQAAIFGSRFFIGSLILPLFYCRLVLSRLITPQNAT